MSGSRNSSLSKLQKPKKPLQSTTPLEPMTELYLRQFFKNHTLKIDRKQKQTMFSNSIQVLNFLIEEYQEKFGIQAQDEQPAFTLRQGKQFQGFYNRLKNMFETLYDKIENQSMQSNNQAKKRTNAKDSQDEQNYEDYLFPQNIKVQNKKPAIKSSQPQTDQELYQLVIDLKKKSEEDNSKIKKIQRDLKEKQKNFKSLEQKYKESIQQMKKKQKENQDLTESLSNILQQKNQYQQRCTKLQETLRELKHNIEKTEVVLLLKDEQIKRLEISEKALNQVSKQKAQLREKLQELNEKHKVAIQQKKAQQQKTNEISETAKQVKQENKKLRKIIANKLSLLGSNANKQNLNTSTNYDQENRQNNEYLKGLFTSTIKNQQLINSNVQKELKHFIQNLIQKDKILPQNPTKTNQIPSNSTE